MEEREALDKKELEQEYINSYKYNTRQKAWGCVMAFGMICSVTALYYVVLMLIIGYFSQ